MIVVLGLLAGEGCIVSRFWGQIFFFLCLLASLICVASQYHQRLDCKPELAG